VTDSKIPSNASAAKPKRKVADEVFRLLAPVVIIAAGIGGFVVFGQRPEAAPRETQEDVAAAVETAPIEPSDGRITIKVDGVAVPYRQVTHSAEVAGRVTKKVADCRAGHYAEAGEFLMEIDPTDYQLEVERLNVEIQQADENLAEVDVDLANTQSLIELAKEDLRLQQQNLQRVQRLAARSATTDTQLDTARMEELASRNALQSLQNQLNTLKQRNKTLQAAKKLAQTALRRAEVDVARTKVSAPLSGTLVSVEVEEGDYVKEGDPLFTMNDTQTMEVSCQLRVDELYWVWLQAGTFGASPRVATRGLEVATRGRESVFEIPNVPVEVAYPFRDAEYVWSGVLSRYDGTGLDPNTRTIPCRVRVDEPTNVRVGVGTAGAVAPPTLFSGMYVDVRIPIETPVPMLRVPLTALRPGGELWVVRDGHLDIVSVDVARKEGDAALLRMSTEGPQVGERVVTSPLAAVEDGMAVRDMSTEDAASVASDEPDPAVGNGAFAESPASASNAAGPFDVSATGRPGSRALEGDTLSAEVER